MNRRIYNPPLAKAGEPTPADAQATATVRIPNVTAAGNQLSSIIRNLNDLKTDDTKINTRIELARAKIEELKELIQTEHLSATTKGNNDTNHRAESDKTKSEENASEFIPAMHTIPTIVYHDGGIVTGWAEVTYGKVEKPANYTDTDDDLYHIRVRIYYEYARFSMKWYREYPNPPYFVLEQEGLSHPVPSSRYIYLCGWSRSKIASATADYWTAWNPGPIYGTTDKLYTQEFPHGGSHPGTDKTVNVSMMLRGYGSAIRKSIGESEDTAIYIENTPRPVGWFPINRNRQWGDDPLHWGSPDGVNHYQYCSDWVIFCTAQDIKEFNKLAERHPDELYKIPLID